MKKQSKRMRAIPMILLLLLPLAGTAFAQDTLKINLDQALEIALSENPTVKVADKEIKRYEYARKERAGGLLPTVSLVGTYSRILQKQTMVLGDQSIRIGTDNSWVGGVNLSLPIVAPALWKTVQLSEKDVELAVESARSSRISLVYQVRKAYYDLLLAQDSHKALLTGYKNSELNAGNITNKFNQGLVSEYDKLRADVQLKSLIPNLTAAENAVSLATMQLKVLMGLDVDERISFTGSLSDFEHEMGRDLSYLSDGSALNDNADLRQLDIQTEQLELVRAINKASMLPSLSLSGYYQWTSMNNNFRVGHYQWNPYSGVGLTLSIPLFEGRAKVNRDKQNQINIENIKLQRENLVRNLELSVNNSLNNIQRAVNQVSSNRENIIRAEKAYEISRIRYDVGSGTFIELNDSELTLTQTRLAYNQSVYDYLTARAELERTLGGSIGTAQ